MLNEMRAEKLYYELKDDDDIEDRIGKLELARDETKNEIEQIEVLIQKVNNLSVKPNSAGNEQVKIFLQGLVKEKEYLTDILDEQESSISFVSGL